MPLTIRRRLIDRVRQWRKIAYAACVALIVLASAGGLPVGVVPRGQHRDRHGTHLLRLPTAPSAPPRACGRTCPRPPPGLEEQADVINWIISQLPDPDMAKQSSPSKPPMGNEKVTLQNIAVVLAGGPARGHPHRCPAGHAHGGQSRAARLHQRHRGSSLSSSRSSPPVRTRRPWSFSPPKTPATAASGISHFLDSSDIGGNVSTILSVHGLGKEASESGVRRSLSAGVTAAQGTTPGWYVQLAGDVLGEAGLEARRARVCSARRPTTPSPCPRATR